MKLANTQSNPQAQTKELVLSDLFGSDAAKMTSLDMEVVTGKRHSNIKRTIKTLVARGVIELPQIEIISTATKPVEVFVFQGNQAKRDSLIVVAQLSPEFTADIVDRWIFLETENKSLRKQLEKWQSKELSDKARGSIHGKGLAERKKTKNLNNRMIADLLERMQLRLSI